MHSLLQFFVASFVYYTTSVLFPARVTMLEEAILDDKSDGHSGSIRSGKGAERGEVEA